MSSKRWVPLESNPDVLTKYAGQLGLNTKRLVFTDIFGLDEELLAFVPQPVFAVLLLFPVTAKLDEEAAEEDRRKREGGETIDTSIFYMKQTIGNACGTIGVLHAIGNIREAADLREGSFFQEFFQLTSAMDPQQRGSFLEDPPEGAPTLEDAHAEAATEGTSAPELDDNITPHFVALVNHQGRLLELDGRKSFPIDHGPTSQESLLKDAAVVARKFMDRTDSIHFNMIALAPPAET